MDIQSSNKASFYTTSRVMDGYSLLVPAHPMPHGQQLIRDNIFLLSFIYLISFHDILNKFRGDFNIILFNFILISFKSTHKTHSIYHLFLSNFLFPVLFTLHFFIYKKKIGASLRERKIQRVNGEGVFLEEDEQVLSFMACGRLYWGEGNKNV